CTRKAFTPDLRRVSISKSAAEVNLASRVIGLVFLLLAAGCATMKKSYYPMPKTVVLSFHGKPGAVSETRYYSNSRILSYEEQQLVRDRYEGVDFTVDTHVQDYSPQDGVLKFDVKTVRKDGTASLHDLAFPELDEQMDYVIRSNGDVLQAGLYPPQSLFYVPSMPIPDHPVAVG